MLYTGLYHTAYRYESLNIQGSRGQYRDLFGTQGSPCANSMAISEEWKEQGRMFDGLSLIYTLAMRRIWLAD